MFRKLFSSKSRSKTSSSPDDYPKIVPPRDWVPSNIPLSVKKIFELTYLSIQKGLSREEIIDRMPKEELNMPIDVANEFYDTAYTQWNYDFTASIFISKKLGNEIGMESKGAFQKFIHSIIYYFRRGNSIDQIVERVLKKELEFGEISNLTEEPIIKQLVIRTATDISTKLEQ